MSATEHTTPRRLNLGCGFDHRPGYLNVDFQDFHHPDLKADVRDLSALADATFEEALALDVLEHLERKDVLPALREWHRVLAPGGSLHVRVPDLAGIGALLAQRDELELHHTMVHGSYGTQADSGDYHLAGFTDLTLIDQLFDAGFERIRTSRMHDWLLVATACRPMGDGDDRVAIGLRGGISEPESDLSGEWRWCEQEANVLLFARADRPVAVRLELELLRPGEPAELELRLDGCVDQRAELRGATTLTSTLTVAPGPNALTLISRGPQLLAPEDPRSLHFQLRAVRATTLGSPAAVRAERGAPAARGRDERASAGGSININHTRPRPGSMA